MLSITNESDFQVGTGLVAVKFWATWCGPCKRLDPALQKMEEEFGSKMKFLSIEIEQIPSIAQKHRIRTLPTILLLKNGREINRITGLVLTEALRKAFRDFTKDIE